MVRCAIDLGIFGMLAESTSALTTSSLSKAADVHPAFLERLLRYLASMKYIEETVEGHWGGTSVCTALACMGFAAGVKF
jgi:demethylsterigmatocystin 6-O-methyltransferase